MMILRRLDPDEKPAGAMERPLDDMSVYCDFCYIGKLLSLTPCFQASATPAVQSANYRVLSIHVPIPIQGN